MANYSKIVINDFSGMVSNADQEDLGTKFAATLVNLKPHNGRLIKTKVLTANSDYRRFDLDLTEDQVNSIVSICDMRNDHITIEDNAKTHLLIAVGVHSTTGAVTVFAYDSESSEWKDATAILSKVGPDIYLFSYPTTVYIHKQINTIIQSFNTLRVIPGNETVIRSNNITHVWIGWIDRKRFDETETIDPKFYIKSGAITPYDSLISMSFTKEFFNDEAIVYEFEATYDSAAKTLTFNEDQNLSGVAGIYYLTKIYVTKTTGASAEVSDYYLSGINKVIVLTTTLPNAADGDTVSVKFPKMYAVRDKGDEKRYYYKYSLIFDYSQESLLCDSIYSEICGENEAIIPEINIPTSLDNRVTGVNIYRSISPNGSYYKINTIDLVRDISENVMTGSSGAGCCDKIYIADSTSVAAYSFSSGTNYWIYLKTIPNKTGNESVYKISIGTSLSGSGFNVFDVDTNNFIDNTRWDAGDGYKYTWELRSGAAGGSLLLTGDEAYFGDNCVSIEDETNDKYIACPGALLKIVDTNEIFTIITEVNYVENVETGNTDMLLRVSHSPVELALKSALSVNIADTIDNILDNKAWGIYHPTFGYSHDGTTSGEEKYKFVDYELLDGAIHPLLGVGSLNVNGKYGLYLNGRMFVANVVIEKDGEIERHDDFLCYSEVDQPDIIPISNYLQISDADSGPITGLDQIGETIIVTKKTCIYTIEIVNIQDPITWIVRKIAHNIGNTGEYGALVVRGILYVSTYDGIYKLERNNLAESDRTPTKNLKISDPIQDQLDLLQSSTFDVMSNIKPYYSPDEGVIHFHIYNSTTGYHADYVYDLQNLSWRIIVSPLDDTFYRSFLDEDGLLVGIGDEDRSAFMSYTESSCRVTYKSPVFKLSDIRSEIIRNITATYKAAVDGDTKLYVEIYDADTDTLILRDELTEKTKVGILLLGIRDRAKRFYIIITSSSVSSGNLIGTEIFELDSLTIEHS